MHHNRQQCLVAKWLGLSVTVRARVRARARECIFPFFFFFFVLKVTNTFVLCVNGNCNVCGIRTTRDVTMMYCQKWYMENVPLWVSKIVKLFSNVPGFSRELIGLVAATEL